MRPNPLALTMVILSLPFLCMHVRESGLQKRGSSSCFFLSNCYTLGIDDMAAISCCAHMLLRAMITAVALACICSRTEAGNSQLS